MFEYSDIWVTSVNAVASTANNIYLFYISVRAGSNLQELTQTMYYNIVTGICISAMNFIYIDVYPYLMF